MINIQIKNAQQIKSAFRMSPYLMTKNLSGAIKRVALNVTKESKKITPVKTGFLRRSHTTTFETPLRATIEPMASYALYVHDGTRFMKSRPFLADAVEFSEGYTDAEFEKAVQDTLNQIGARV